MLEFLKDLYIKANIVAKSFKRDSDNSEAAYDADLHSVAKSGDYNELKNQPDLSLDPHNNDFHTETYETTTGAQQKADNAEAAANTYTDSREDVLELKLKDTKDHLKQLGNDYYYQRQLLFGYYLDNDVQSVLNADEAGYWFSPLTNLDNGLDTTNIVTMDSRIKAISDHHVSKYKNFDTRYSDLNPIWWADD